MGDIEGASNAYVIAKKAMDTAVIAESTVIIADAVVIYDIAAKIFDDAIAAAKAPGSSGTITGSQTFLTAAKIFKDIIKITVTTNDAISRYIAAADALIAEIRAEVGGNVPADPVYDKSKTDLDNSVKTNKTTISIITNYESGAVRTFDDIIKSDSVTVTNAQAFLDAAFIFKNTATDGTDTRSTTSTALTTYVGYTIARINSIIGDKIDSIIASKDGTIAGKESTIVRLISDKLKAVKEAINELESKTMINNRVGHNFIQDKVLSQYTNNILFLLYYVIFILFAVSLYLNRESYNTFLIVILLLIFGVLPFIIKYITNFAYNRFLDIAHIFYNGNARYLGPKAMPQ